MKRCYICGKEIADLVRPQRHVMECEKSRDRKNALEPLLHGDKICDLGCGLQARFVLKLGQLCCSSTHNACPSMAKHFGWKKGRSRGKTWNKGKNLEELMGKKAAKEWKRRASKRLVGRVTSDDTKKLLSKIAKENGFGGYRIGGGRSKHGWYKGVWCDSSWELAWVMFHLDHKTPFEKNRDKFDYQWEGEMHKYLPDFKMQDGQYVEIKAWINDHVMAKLNSCPGVKVLMKKEMEPYLEYAINKYGKDFIRMYDKRPS